MKTRLLLLALSTAALWTASAQTNLAITNPLFVNDQLKCGSGQTCRLSGITGWISGPITGIAVFSKTQYPSALAAGPYAAYLGKSNGSGAIYQTLGVTVQANTTYTLEVEVGARADESFTGYEAALLAGNVVLTEGDHATPVGGTFVPETLVYDSGAIPAQLGNSSDLCKEYRLRPGRPTVCESQG